MTNLKISFSLTAQFGYFPRSAPPGLGRIIGATHLYKLLCSPDKTSRSVSYLPGFHPLLAVLATPWPEPKLWLYQLDHGLLYLVHKGAGKTNEKYYGGYK